MEDAELILRFFAMRHIDNFSKGMEEFLDNYMMKSINFSEQDIEILKNIFIETIDLAYKIYQENLFKPYDPQSQSWKKQAYKAYYDAIMVGLSRHLEHKKLLVEQKSKILEGTKKLLSEDKRKLFSGSGRTKADIQKRIQLFDNMLSKIINK